MQNYKVAKEEKRREETSFKLRALRGKNLVGRIILFRLEIELQVIDPKGYCIEWYLNDTDVK